MHHFYIIETAESEAMCLLDLLMVFPRGGAGNFSKTFSAESHRKIKNHGVFQHSGDYSEIRCPLLLISMLIVLVCSCVCSQHVRQWRLGMVTSQKTLRHLVGPALCSFVLKMPSGIIQTWNLNTWNFQMANESCWHFHPRSKTDTMICGSWVGTPKILFNC